MGYMAHHTIVVTSWSSESLLAAHTKANELGCGVSNIVGPLQNAECSFFVAPDGSKEGWPESDEGDHRRAMFIAWLRRERSWCDWVAVRFGGDDPDLARITVHCEREAE